MALIPHFHCTGVIFTSLQLTVVLCLWSSLQDLACLRVTLGCLLYANSLRELHQPRCLWVRLSKSHQSWFLSPNIFTLLLLYLLCVSKGGARKEVPEQSGWPDFKQWGYANKQLSSASFPCEAALQTVSWISAVYFSMGSGNNKSGYPKFLLATCSASHTWRNFDHSCISDEFPA